MQWVAMVSYYISRETPSGGLACSCLNVSDRLQWHGSKREKGSPYFAVGGQQSSVLKKNLPCIRVVYVNTVIYIYINEQKVGLLLQKKNRYKRSRDK